MPDGATVIYRYDGSFEGFLCCVFEAFRSKDDVAGIVAESAAQGTLFPVKDVATEPEKARRVFDSLDKKIGPAAREAVMTAFLSNDEEKEQNLLNFLRLGYRRGQEVMNMLAADEVHRIFAAVRNVRNEAHKYKGFVRFSEIDGMLYAVIEPKNHVLPLLADHFKRRFPRETFVIYDAGRRLALICRENGDAAVPVARWEPPAAGGEERAYRALWKTLYDAAAVEERLNPRLRRTHMPMRYWSRLTEFGGDPLSAPAFTQAPGED